MTTRPRPPRLERLLTRQTIELAWLEACTAAAKLPKNRSELDRRVWACMNATISLAAARGVDRAELGKRLGLKLNTMDDRARPGKNRPFNVFDLGRLLLGDALPIDVREHVLCRLLSTGAYTLVHQTEAAPDRGPVLQQLAEIQVAFGKLNDDVLDSRSPGSPAGVNISDRERKERVEAIEAVERELAQLKAATLHRPGQTG